MAQNINQQWIFEKLVKVPYICLHLGQKLWKFKATMYVDEIEALTQSKTTSVLNFFMSKCS